MDLRREWKRSHKVCEQQEAEFERIEASKKRYGYIMLGLMFIVAIIIHHRQCKKTSECTMARGVCALWALVYSSTYRGCRIDHGLHESQSSTGTGTDCVSPALIKPSCTSTLICGSRQIVESAIIQLSSSINIRCKNIFVVNCRYIYNSNCTCTRPRVEIVLGWRQKEWKWELRVVRCAH